MYPNMVTESKAEIPSYLAPSTLSYPTMDKAEGNEAGQLEAPRAILRRLLRTAREKSL